MLAFELSRKKRGFAMFKLFIGFFIIKRKYIYVNNQIFNSLYSLLMKIKYTFIRIILRKNVFPISVYDLMISSMRSGSVKKTSFSVNVLG